MKNEKILPFANETKKLKSDFKKMIDEMPDEEFIDMMFFLISSGFEEDFDEEFEDDFNDDFENPFYRLFICKRSTKRRIETSNLILYNWTRV